MKETSTDFFNYGTYKNPDADISRKELEEAGIPVKTLYPGTSIGKETMAGAYWTAYKLLIRVCDFQRAEEIRNNLNIAAVEVGEPMPLPKVYKWSKYTFSRFFLTGLMIFLLALIILSALSYIFKSSINTNNLGGVLMVGYSLSALLLAGSLIYRFLKDWFKK